MKIQAGEKVLQNLLCFMTLDINERSETGW